MRVIPANVLNSVAWLGLAVIWGTTWSVVTIGLRDLPPFLFAGVRFLLAALLLFLSWPLTGVTPPRGRGQWRLVVVAGLLIFALAYACQFWGQQYTASGVPAIVFATVPLLTMLLGHFVIAEERLTMARATGAVLGIGGVGVIFADQLVGGTEMAVLGVLAFFVGAVAIAVAQVLLKMGGGNIHPAAMAAPQMLIGAFVLLAISFLTEPFPSEWPVAALASIGYLAVVGSAVGFQLFYWLMKRMTVSRLSSMMLVHPVVAVILGGAFLDETLSPRTFVGAGLVLLGLAMVLRRSPAAVTPLKMMEPVDEPG